MANVIATISLKGGVGKTTVTAGVAEFLALGRDGRGLARSLMVEAERKL